MTVDLISELRNLTDYNRTSHLLLRSKLELLVQAIEIDQTPEKHMISFAVKQAKEFLNSSQSNWFPLEYDSFKEQ